MLYSLLPILVSIFSLSAATLLIIKRSKSGASSKTGAYKAEVERRDAAIAELIGDPNDFVSAGQIAAIDIQLQEVQKLLDSERATLQKIEATLDTAQKEVESKELSQQELKISREEDEKKLQELLAEFEEITKESVKLESNLANSLQDLERMLSDLELSADQRQGLEELSAAIESAGQLLRDLIIEYKSVTQRLQAITQQQADLEEEYTKLVEQQLGENP